MNIFKKIILSIRYLFDSRVPFRKKIWLIITILYIVSPIDLIPEPVMLFGILDDLTLLTFVLSKLSSELEDYSISKEKEEKEKNIKDKIIEDVEYDIKEDKE